MARPEIIQFIALPIAFVAFLMAAQLSAGLPFRTSTPNTVLASVR